MAAVDKPRNIDYKGKADLVTESVFLCFNALLDSFGCSGLINYAFNLSPFEAPLTW